jgi:hypothetical protein
VDNFVDAKTGTDATWDPPRHDMRPFAPLHASPPIRLRVAPILARTNMSLRRAPTDSSRTASPRRATRRVEGGPRPNPSNQEGTGAGFRSIGLRCLIICSSH